jgi:hypothetical protein
MTRLIQVLALAIMGALSLSTCLGQERALRPLHFPDARANEVFERQDRSYRRLEARNARAQRSICEDGCRTKGRAPRTQPADPFAELPSWETDAGLPPSPVDDP